MKILVIDRKKDRFRFAVLQYGGHEVVEGVLRKGICLARVHRPELIIVYERAHRVWWLTSFLRRLRAVKPNTPVMVVGGGGKEVKRILEEGGAEVYCNPQGACELLSYISAFQRRNRVPIHALGVLELKSWG